MNCRFPFNSLAARQTAQEAVELDMRRAYLPPRYRCYYSLRKVIPCWARRLLQRRAAVGLTPDWYLPSDYYARLARSVDLDGLEHPIIHPWPGGAEVGVVLTHDVELQDALRHVDRIAALEEDLGFRSTWNFVPGGGMDHGLIEDLREREFEIGVHGFSHDGRLFASKQIFDERVPKINQALQELRARGFRAPMVHRNLEWMQRLDMDYDGSCFDIDPLQPMPGGVGTIWPFIAGRFVELPYTLPQDHSLFVVLREADGRIWQRKAAWLRQRCGMVMMLTHPDYLNSDRRLAAYQDVLLSIKEGGNYWHGLAWEAARWWRSRDASSVRQVDGRWTIEGSAATCAVPARLRVTDGLIKFEQVAHVGAAQQVSPQRSVTQTRD